MSVAVLASVFLVATCGLVYELVCGTLASYLLGDTVTQFSTVIGVYLSSMGLGSFLSRYIRRGLASRFVQLELFVGLVGGFSAMLLFVTFAYALSFRLALYAVVVVVGAGVGLEIPLLLRILAQRVELGDLVSGVLSADYAGALAASLLFPIVLLPHMGLLRASLLFGVANALVALWSTWIFAAQIARPIPLRISCGLATALLLAGFAASDRVQGLADGNLYADEVILTRTSLYQHIVLTRWKDDLRLFLNGHLQFSSRDERRYHEALIHPGLAAVPAPRRVLILGGGDGLAAREILRYPTVAHVDLIDIDHTLTDLFARHPMLTPLNGGSLTDPRLSIITADAFTWLAQTDTSADFIVVDLPDPTSFALGKLYTTAFYRLVARHLSAQGLCVVQATSPLFARQSFWCIARTMKDAGLEVAPYHVYVPSFGEWGFVLGGHRPFVFPESLPSGLRFLTPEVGRSMFAFPIDMAPVDGPVNHLDNQSLVQLYEEEWRAIVK